MAKFTEDVLIKEPKSDSIADAMRRILALVGEDPERQGLTDTPERFGAAMAELDGAWRVADTPPQARPLIIDRIIQ